LLLDNGNRPAAGEVWVTALVLLGAQQRPDLARCVAMLDTSIVADWRAGLLRPGPGLWV